MVGNVVSAHRGAAKTTAPPRWECSTVGIITTVVLSLLAALSLIGCGAKKQESSTSSPSAAASAPQSSIAPPGQTALPFADLEQPRGLAVDTAGNVYVGDSMRILKLDVNSAQQTVLPFTGIGDATGVAVDSAGKFISLTLQTRE